MSFIIALGLFSAMIYAKPPVSKIKDFYRQKRGTSINVGDSICIIELNDPPDTLRPYVDSFCQLVQILATNPDDLIYAVEIRTDSKYLVEIVWYGIHNEKFYLLSDEMDYIQWIRDRYNIERRYNMFVKRGKTKFKRNETNAAIYNRIETYLMTYNCYYRKDLKVPKRLIRKLIKGKKPKFTKPLIFTVEPYQSAADVYIFFPVVGLCSRLEPAVTDH